MFDLFPVVVYSLFIILIVANFANLAIGRMFAFVYARIGDLPPQLLVPLIMLMAVIGSYAVNQNSYDVLVMLAFGLIGFGMRLFGIPAAPMIITFLVTPLAEASIRRALLINQGQWLEALFHSPLAIGLACAVVIFLVLSIRVGITERLAEMASQEAKAQRAAESNES